MSTASGVGLDVIAPREGEGMTRARVAPARVVEVAVVPETAGSRGAAAGSTIARAPSAERVDRLARTAGLRLSWVNLAPIAAVHLLALLAVIPWLFTWTGLIVMTLGISAFGSLGVTLCYHRLLTHRSFKTPRWFERVLVMLALCSLEGPPATWVATHRWHHAHSDEQEDVHSPLVSFLWAHIGWLVFRDPQVRTRGMYERFARDLLNDPFYMRLEKRLLWAKIYALHAALFFLVGPLVALIARLVTGTWAVDGLQLGLSLLVWGVLVRTVLVWHITWSINSLTHIFGYQSHATGDDSRNNWVVALLAAGEGWHNNHHADPACASNRRKWWEIDQTYGMICLLEKVGLAWDVVRPRGERMAAAKAGNGQ